MQECLDSLCHSIESIAPGTRAGIVLTDLGGELQTCVAAPGMPRVAAVLDALGAPDPAAESARIRSILLESGADVVNVSGDDSWPIEWQEAFEADAVRGLLVIPTHRSGSVVGGSLLLGFEQARQADDWERHVAEAGSVLAGIILHRDRSDSAVRESEHRMRTMADSAPAILWLTEPDGSCQFLSRGWYEYTGQTPEQALGFGWLEASHPDDIERIRAVFARANEDRAPFAFDYRLLCADGNYRWVTDAGRPRYDAGGGFIGYIGSVFDIHDKKIAEQALRESEQRFRHMADAAPVLIWVCDDEQNGVYFNDQWLEFTGQAMEGRPGREWLDAIHPEDRPLVMDANRRAHQSGLPWSMELRLRRKDTRYRWALAHGVARINDDGSLAGFIGSCVDISDRRASEQALRESESRFRTLADNISQFAWMADAAGWIFWYNQRWYDFTGTTYEEMQGWGWEKVHHPDHVQRVVESWGRSLASGEPWEDNFPLRHKDGTYGWFLSRAQPIRDEHGNILRWFGTNTDITQQRLIEDELARHRAELEHRVEERTQRLKETYERLRMSERMAMMGTLSAGLGHDLGNLLVPVRVRLESLAAEPLSEQAQEDVEAIRTSAEYLRRLANGLRMLALDPERANTGEPTELASWWADSQGVLKSVLPSGIDLQCVSCEPMSVQMSKAALTQVVFNLVQNAGDALREQGSGRVSVAWRATGDHVEITVFDNGPGMEPDVLARCMEPFFTTKTRGISTGLGLVLVYGLVKDAGGTVEPASTPGRGTTFTILLPLIRTQQEAEDCAGERWCAVVEVKDARVRSFLAGELRAMKIAVESFEALGGQASIYVVDDPQRLGLVPPEADVLYLGEMHPAPANVRTLGSRPGMTSLRETLREVIRSRRSELKAGESQRKSADRSVVSDDVG